MTREQLQVLWEMLHMREGPAKQVMLREVDARLSWSTGDPKSLQRWMAAQQDDVNLFLAYFTRPQSRIGVRPLLIPRNIPQAKSLRLMDLCLWRQHMICNLKCWSRTVGEIIASYASFTFGDLLLMVLPVTLHTATDKVALSMQDTRIRVERDRRITNGWGPPHVYVRSLDEFLTQLSFPGSSTSSMVCIAHSPCNCTAVIFFSDVRERICFVCT